MLTEFYQVSIRVEGGRPFNIGAESAQDLHEQIAYLFGDDAAELVSNIVADLETAVDSAHLRQGVA